MDKVCMDCGATPEERELVVIITKGRRQQCKCPECLLKGYMPLIKYKAGR